MKIVECKSDEQILNTFDVMVQLGYEHLKKEEYVDLVKEMMSQGYRLFSCNDDKEVVAVAGIRNYSRLWVEKIMYIEDLVVNKGRRSENIGSKMLDWIKREAGNLDCESIVLDSGSHRVRAHKFYLNEDFVIDSFFFKYDIDEAA